jgi:hypothetical protein
MTHSHAVTRSPASLLIVGLALLASSCGSGLAFVQDRRLEFTAPQSHEKVTLPVTIRWKVEGFRLTGPDGSPQPGAGYFGVFVDRTPVPPGRPLSWIARDDRPCLRTPGCPDETYLSDRRVHSTNETEITFEHLPDLGASRGHESHEVTIVLLDGSGRRIGESAWYIGFLYDREVP